MRIIVKNVIVEIYHSIELVERYHESLRRVYTIIITEILEIEFNLTLQMIFKAFNDSVKLNEFISTLLVFDVYFRMIEMNLFSSTITQRIVIMRKAIKEIRKLLISRQIDDAFNTRNKSFTSLIHNLSLNSLILMFRKSNTSQSESWKESYKLLSLQDESAIIELSNDFVKFRVISVKSYYDLAIVDMNENENHEDARDTISEQASSVASASQTFAAAQSASVKRDRERSRKHSEQINWIIFFDICFVVNNFENVDALKLSQFTSSR